MKKPARIALGVAGILVVLAAVGAGVWLAMIVNRADEVAAEVERSLEDGPLATNNALVERLYGQFEISTLQGFYADILLDGWLGEYTREEGQLEMALNQAENLSGEAVRAKYREMFGEEVELTEEKYGDSAGKMSLVRGMKIVAYEAGNDEFIELSSPMTAGTGRYVRRLERAEKATKIGEDGETKEEIYLYERALAVSCKLNLEFDEEGNRVDKGSSCGVLTVAATCGTPEFGWSETDDEMTDEEIFTEASRAGIGLVKWTFEKNAEGNYVFKDLERAIEGGEDAD